MNFGFPFSRFNRYSAKGYVPPQHSISDVHSKRESIMEFSDSKEKERT